MTLSSRDQLCVREKAGALQAGELLSALQNCFAGLDKAAARVNREPGCTAAKLAHDTWVCSWLCVMERAAELVETERFPQQAVVGAIRDGLRSWPAAAQSLLQQHSAEALQSPSALPLLLHSLPVAAACAQAAFLSAAVNLLPSSRGEEYPLSPLAISNLRQYLIQALSQHPSRECTKEAQSPNCTGDGSAGHSVMCRGLSAPAASQASATAHMLGGRDRPKPPALKFNPLRKKPGNISGLHMESSVTAESQDPKAATAEQVPAASQQDDLAAAVAGVARCIMTDLLEPARLIGWLGLQQPQASPTKTAAAEGQEGAAAEVEHSKGLLEILTLHHEVASEMLKKRWHGTPAPRRRSGRQVPHAYVSKQPEATVKAAIPISAADAALSLTLAHLKHVMNGRDQMQHKTGGLGRAQIDMDRLNVTEAAQMAWQVYSQCVEAADLP
ncbi:hypothetical protein WJX84_007414 [Apatococcus fuscideae]|uniref:Uncharacterized protein n=1 Tax=Apatococcus fuscideae TaxID=2026836 RepID=A0AAW1SKU4_9CHLO